MIRAQSLAGGGTVATLPPPVGDYVLVHKTGWFWTALAWIVRIVTLGGNKNFRDGYLTTIGKWIGVPPSWEIAGGRPTHPSQYPVVCHELRHVRQFRALGLGSPVLGILPMLLLYLVPLPLGLALGRYLLERTAYVDGFRAELEAARLSGGDIVATRQRCIDHGVEELTGPRYGWTWPFPATVRRYFEENL